MNNPDVNKLSETPAALAPVSGSANPITARNIALAAYNDLMNLPAPSAGDTLGFRRAIMLAVLIGRTLESTELESPNETDQRPPT